MRHVFRNTLQQNTNLCNKNFRNDTPHNSHHIVNIWLFKNCRKKTQNHDTIRYTPHVRLHV